MIVDEIEKLKISLLIRILDTVSSKIIVTCRNMETAEEIFICNDENENFPNEVVELVKITESLLPIKPRGQHERRYSMI